MFFPQVMQSGNFPNAESGVIAFRPVRIGALRLDFPFLLAPMAGYTDAAFRWMCLKNGCGAAFTELANAEGLVRSCRQSWYLLETFQDERPLFAHIYGANPDSMARAAALIEKTGRFAAIDVNAGCPVRKIMAKGAGAALIRTPERLAAIIRAIRSAVSLPVTVKTRIGIAPSENSIADTARLMEDAGAHALHIHARYASAHHHGAADWDALAGIKSLVSIPVFGNGGVATPDDALMMMKQTGVDGVMIGRAAVGRPWIFRHLRAIACGAQPHPPSPEQIGGAISLHLDKLVEHKSREWRRRRAKFSAETAAVLHFRAHLVRYMSGFRGFGELRRSLDQFRTRDEVIARVLEIIAASGR